MGGGGKSSSAKVATTQTTQFSTPNDIRICNGVEAADYVVWYEFEQQQRQQERQKEGTWACCDEGVE